MSEPDRDLADALLRKSDDDLWGERRNARHDNRVMGDTSFRIENVEPPHNYTPLLLLILVVIAIIVGVIYASAGLMQ